MSFLLDSDTCSAHLKSGALGHRMIQHAGRLHISAVTLAELYAWALRRKAPARRMQTLIDFLDDVVILDVTPDVAHQYGEVQAGLLDVGQPAPEMDLLIGATALVHNLTVVTHNHHHFARIPGLRLDDWLIP